jgi:hypothetical protein
MHLQIKINIASLEWIDTGPTECRTDMQGIDLSGIRVRPYRPYTRPVRKSGTQWDKGSNICFLVTLFTAMFISLLRSLSVSYAYNLSFSPNFSLLSLILLLPFFHALVYFLPPCLCLPFS